MILVIYIERINSIAHESMKISKWIISLIFLILDIVAHINSKGFKWVCGDIPRISIQYIRYGYIDGNASKPHISKMHNVQETQILFQNKIETKCLLLLFLVSKIYFRKNLIFVRNAYVRF